MAAEITLYAGIGNANNPEAQVPIDPINSYTASFTAPQNGSLRVYANGGAVVLTWDGITWTVPSGSVEYFGIRKGTSVTVA